jgi:anti-sigma B factor antagonist
LKLELRDGTLSVAGIRELDAENSESFREQVCSAIPERVRHIEVDLSHTRYVDSCGLGALISLRNAARSRDGTVRLLNPSPRVRLLFNVTRMQRLFEIVQSPADPQYAPLPAGEGWLPPSSSAAAPPPV